ncbi:alpha/beta hydrolase [[Pseudomonas] carboxydohydrogena]|uniref:Alpha/beta hydrolase n=1 Tax=Afipia carboxydohydrogena TaxID=290 RepID=A0ABY8BP98_AFICR|nr:alpha/beta hydrolase [[Pseudomonas] carboxydohydrogena]WEF51815.1 alpha/beta hydrolase [[Pseudomonas] carboxydohydrogena]
MVIRTVLIAGLTMAAVAANARTPAFGPAGPEGEPARRQEWRVPTPDAAIASHALLFRPQGEGPFPVAIIAHASVENEIQRAQMTQPEYAHLALALVARGFAVLVPQRPGHGATGGPYLEGQGGCDAPDYPRAAQTTGREIGMALDFLRTQPFARKDGSVIAGHSAGGFGALALAQRDPREISAIIVFAPGRGGHAHGHAGDVCAPEKLIVASGALGQNARVPVTWLVADNDSYFSPALSKHMADAFRAGGDRVTFRVLPPHAHEGHFFVEESGQGMLGSIVESVVGKR